MTKNHVKSFKGNGTHCDLELELNRYCRNHNCNPISISVIWSGGTYIAFGVVEGGADHA